MNSYTNTYGDTIVSVKDEIPDVTLLPRDVPVILNSNIELFLDEFKLMVKTDNNFMYANVLAQKDFPGFDCGKLRRVRAVIIIKVRDQKKRKILGVRTGWANPIKNVSGTVNRGESVRQCLIREIEEETNIKPFEITSITYCNATEYTTILHGHKIPARCTLFEVRVHLSARRLAQIKNYSSSEIVKVHIVRVNKCFNTLEKDWDVRDLVTLRSLGFIQSS